MDAGGLVTDDITNAMVDERLGPGRRGAAAASSTASPAPSGRPSSSTACWRGWAAPSARCSPTRCRRRPWSTASAAGAAARPAAPSTTSRRTRRRRRASATRTGRRSSSARTTSRRTSGTRMQEYAAKTAPLKAFYQARGQVAEVDGLGAPDAILAATPPPARPPSRRPVAMDALSRERIALKSRRRDRAHPRPPAGWCTRCSPSCAAAAPRRHHPASSTGMAEALTRRRGAEPAFKGYHGFPASLCVSVNEEVVHGIPSARTGAAPRATSSASTSAWCWTASTATRPSRCRWGR